MTTQQERFIRITVAALFLMVALAVIGFWDQVRATERASEVFVIGEAEDGQGLEVKLENGRWTVLVDGKAVPEDRILRHGKLWIVLDEDGEAAYQVIVSDDGKEIVSASKILTVPRLPKGKRGLYIGVILDEVDDALAAQLGLEDRGIVVREVIEDSPAEKAGVREWDIITEAAGKPVSSAKDLQRLLSGMKEGDRLELTLLRGGKRTSLTVIPEKREGDGPFVLDDHEIHLPGGFGSWVFDPDELEDLRDWSRGAVRFFRHRGRDMAFLSPDSPDFQRALEMQKKIIEMQEKQLGRSEDELKAMEDRLEKLEEQLRELLEKKE